MPPCFRLAPLPVDGFHWTVGDFGVPSPVCLEPASIAHRFYMLCLSAYVAFRHQRHAAGLPCLFTAFRAFFCSAPASGRVTVCIPGCAIFLRCQHHGCSATFLPTFWTVLLYRCKHPFRMPRIAPTLDCRVLLRCRILNLQLCSLLYFCVHSLLLIPSSPFRQSSYAVPLCLRTFSTPYLQHS